MTDREHDWYLERHLEIAAEDAQIAEQELMVYEENQEAQETCMWMGVLIAGASVVTYNTIGGAETTSVLTGLGGASLSAWGVARWMENYLQFRRSPFQYPNE